MLQDRATLHEVHCQEESVVGQLDLSDIQVFNLMVMGDFLV